MVKKGMSILLTIFTLVILIGCQSNESSSIIGKWHPEDEDDTYYLEFKENDQVVFYLGDYSAEGTYIIEEENITLQLTMLGQTLFDEQGTYRIKNDTLSITIDDVTEKFTKIDE